MDKSLIVKLRNYFSDRIEEIKEGSYFPTYEQIKKLPEFSGINRATFRTARNGWYSQHFQMTPVKFSSRVELIKAGYTSENKFAARLENIKGDYISEEEYDNEYDKKLKRKHGFCYIIIGIFPILIALMAGAIPLAIRGWNPSYGGDFFFINLFGYGGIGILLLSIGIFLILRNRSKASKI